VHVLALNPAQSVERVVAFARSQGSERFGALVPTGPYGDRAALAFREAVRRSGGTLVGVQSYGRSASELRVAVDGLARAGRVDAVLVADGTRVAVQATPLLRRSNPQVRMLGTDLWAADASGGGNAQIEGAWYAAASDLLFEQFRTRYRTRYNRDPARRASLGYDAVLLAMRVAAEWPAGQRFPHRLLRARDGFLGVDGAFRFGSDGLAQRALEVREVTASGMRVVAPAPAGFD
jgi:ABC-type branched-subunit amino acid transport system substrate-binding protein